MTALVFSLLRKDPFTGTVFVFRSNRLDRLKLLYRDGSGSVMACTRLEGSTFVWPVIRDATIGLKPAQFEALFSGLDWRRVKAPETRPPTAAQ